MDLKLNIPDLDLDQAEETVAKAHQVCPYSHAIHGNIEVNLSATTNA